MRLDTAASQSQAEEKSAEKAKEAKITLEKDQKAAA